MKGGKEGRGKEGWWVDMHLRMLTRRSGPITLGDRLVGQIMHTNMGIHNCNGEDDISSVNICSIVLD